MDESFKVHQLEEELQKAKARIEYLEKLNSERSVDTPELSNQIEELKESVIDNLHNPLLILDSDLHIVFSNKKFNKTFHTTSEETNGKLIYNLGNDQWNLPQLKTVLETILPSKSCMSNFELEFPEGEAGIEFLTLNASEIKLAGSNESYMLLSIEDITKSKIAHDKLRESEQQFQNLFHSTSSLIAIFDGPYHKIKMANEAIIHAWGKGDDVFGKQLDELLPELKSQGLIDILDEVYRTGKSYHADEVPVALTRNGVEETRYYDFTYSPLKNEYGEIIGVTDIANDVTNKALLNEQIKKSESEFRGLVDMIPNRINLATADGINFFYNKSWVDYLGLSMEELVEKDWKSFVHPDDFKKLQREVKYALKFGESFEIETRVQGKDDEYNWHYTKCIPIKNEKGEVSSWISSSTEIQKMKEEEIRKEAFLRLVSHELKTPVTSIKGYVQLLLSMLPRDNSEVDKKLVIKPYLNRIETQVERLIRLIREMLDLSRIEQSELILQLTEFNLNDHIKSVVDDLSYSVNEMEVEVKNEDEAMVLADKDRIGQVLNNFITNALKYSPDSNKVDIRIFKNSEDTIAVTVKDFGIGIEKKEQYQIFRRFYRVEGNKDDTYDGFGIGLYLSNEIIDKHQGKILVNSEPGAGSEFTFILPLNNA